MLTWKPSGGAAIAPAWDGFDGNLLVARAIKYDRPDGWRAYVHQQRGSRVHATRDEAMASAEDHYRQVGPKRPQDAKQPAPW